MKKTKEEPIKYQVISLIVVFVIAYALISGIDYYVNKQTIQFEKELQNTDSKTLLGEIISDKLFEIENSFIKIRYTKNIKFAELHKNIIFSAVSDINRLLQILEEGGIYEEEIPLNITDIDKVQEIISYTKPDNLYIQEVIELSPKILDIKTNTDTLTNLIEKKFNSIDSKQIKKTEQKIDLLCKETEALFKRSHESANKIFYDTFLETNELQQNSNKYIKISNIVSKAIYILTILTVLFLTILIYKKIVSLLNERKKNLQNLKDANATIQSLFDAVPVGVILINKEKIIKRVNNMALNLFEAENKEDIVNQSCHICFNLHSSFNCPADTNKPIIKKELTILTKKGKQIPIIKNVIPIKINNEDFLLEAFMDISKQKASEEKLKIAMEKAEESNRLKSAFLANMSHEIRTPMNGILGFSELLTAPDIRPEQVKKYSKIIIKSGNHLLNLLNDIIDIARIESGNFALNTAVVNINQLLKELNSFFQSFINKNNIQNLKLNTIYPVSENNIYVKTDETRLKQILTNLINNAVKFTDKGTIEFGCKIEKQELVFHVKDTGIGIPKSKQIIIFERFNQASETTERLYGGTGLGLTIAKSCTEMLGGKIWLNSEEHKGSEFYFTIPYIQSSSEKTNEHNNEQITPDFNKKTILLVEDNLINSALLYEILTRFNLTVIQCYSAEEAIKIFESDNAVKLVLMDLQLPGKDGNYAIKEIKKMAPHIPIIAQSAYAFETEKQKSFDAGCDDYITKPIASTILLSVIKKYLAK